MNLIEKVKQALSLITEENSVFTVPEAHIEMLFENDPELGQIKEKCKKVTDLMTSLSKDELEKFMEKDFETEIWRMI